MRIRRFPAPSPLRSVIGEPFRKRFDVFDVGLPNRFLKRGATNRMERRLHEEELFHAGWLFSGKIALCALGRWLARRDVRVVHFLGKHNLKNY